MYIFNLPNRDGIFFKTRKRSSSRALYGPNSRLSRKGNRCIIVFPVRRPVREIETARNNASNILLYEMRVRPKWDGDWFTKGVCIVVYVTYTRALRVASPELIIKIKTTGEKLVINYFIKSTHGTSLGILTINVKKKRWKKIKKNKSTKNESRKIPLWGCTRVYK